MIRSVKLVTSVQNVRLCGRCGLNKMSINSEPAAKPIETSIRQKLSENLQPHHIQIINESYMHNVPRGSETHFKVVVVSEKFETLPLINRHRIVNEILKDELKNGVHALSIVAKTPKQWEESSKEVTSSPACKGGFGK
ncbi:bolA-like protein DDB_G0274169 [Schistocerca americana]|uniref:bolA-like protein DDB_G0274169 n=1 Tax=Schistocerca americana TaxID=7009 RepID=UPI001F4FDC2F|nr:bolA-like protein DDB_G0274169 [Schistocerca americana]XP_049780645.1 bolA-like protein DDB_G0274169 [Schistocerca cancellata]XP_049814346.1 bolA-like protein DDB_G0274169 [Schistocerca nitens]XP_049861483.1 bolA-like protein DDB_G0274169 [Schistocerca gregaria]XP_049959295.1 bolA-like protein DDB_G0274169 [Schistocerca serialis cubense]